MALSNEARARLAPQAAEIIGRYPKTRSALLPLLHLVQSEEGYVSADGIEFCADQLGLTEADVTGVVSFYTMYKRKSVGEYHVGVCTTALCGVMGGDANDGKFSVPGASHRPAHVCGGLRRADVRRARRLLHPGSPRDERGSEYCAAL